MGAQTHAVVLASRTFTAALIREGSWGSQGIGTHESTMELMKYSDWDDTRAWIEWDIPAIECCEQIGLTFELIDGKRHLIEYDGVMSLPEQAIELLEGEGIVVGEDFR